MNDLGLPIRTTGRPRHETTVEVVRELRPEDIILANAGAPPPQPIKVLRERHHVAARYVAEGWSNEQISSATGYSAARIASFKCDPSFKDLVAFYSGQKDEEHEEMMGILNGIGKDAALILWDRLETKTEDLSDEFVRRVYADTLDRIGFGAQTKNETNVNFTVNMADKMEAARARLLAKSKVIDLTPVPDPEKA